MVIVMAPEASDADVATVVAHIEASGGQAFVSRGVMRTIVGVVPDTLMQGPFDQQTEAGGFYMPLLGASPATQFATVVVRPRGGQRADTLGPALSKERKKKDRAAVITAIEHPDPPMPKLFPGELTAQDVSDLTAYVESL